MREMGQATVFTPWLRENFGGRVLWVATMRVCSASATIRGVRTTVLIVDDHDDFRASASTLLEAEGFTVVGGVRDGMSAFAAVERLRPEVVLLDIQLPGLDGFAVAERLAAVPDPPRVVLISSREAAAYGPRLDAARAQGFLAKRELSGASLAALVS
jgi:DNA-binding NarL/FixJ family response regulator